MGKILFGNVTNTDIILIIPKSSNAVRIGSEQVFSSCKRQLGEQKDSACSITNDVHTRRS